MNSSIPNLSEAIFPSIALLVCFHTVLRLVSLVSSSSGHLGRGTTLFVAGHGTILGGLSDPVEAVLTRFLPFNSWLRRDSNVEKDNYLHCLQISIWSGQLTSPVEDIGSRTCATKNRSSPSNIIPWLDLCPNPAWKNWRLSSSHWSVEGRRHLIPPCCLTRSSSS